jgi:hypothetical protein
MIPAADALGFALFVAVLCLVLGWCGGVRYQARKGRVTTRELLDRQRGKR